MPLGGEVQQPAGLGEQGDVGGVPGARAGADGGGEVLVGGVLDGDAGVLLEGLQGGVEAVGLDPAEVAQDGDDTVPGGASAGDRKSTRLNSSHVAISYAVFCLTKKKAHERLR